MTPDEHQRERRDFWKAACVAAVNSDLEPAGERADYALESFDKRFPAPSAAAPVEPAVEIANVYDSIDGRVPVIDAAELTSLRQKARLWDAVASGKVRPNRFSDGRWCAYSDMGCTPEYDTPKEAVEAAIAAGALK